MRWKNGLGVTTEIVSEPEGASIDHFLWRLSMARIEAEAPFSAFRGVDRVLTVLEGSLELTVGHEPPVTLKPDGYTVTFSGDSPASARLSAECTATGALDLNLMVRRGRLVPRITRHLIAREHSLPVMAEITAIVCRGPYLAVIAGGAEAQLALDDVLILRGNESSLVRLSSEQTAVVYVAELTASV